MAVPMSKSLACSSCRKWMVRSLIASIGGPATQHLQRRPFSIAMRMNNEARERIHHAPFAEHPLNDIVHDHAITTTRYDPSSRSSEPKVDTSPPDGESLDTPVPWYLQVQQPPRAEENVLSARQRIPDLPDHAPPILQPLLERISVELGMDDLSLLDLRSIDPPPALGANLLMIIGTARSEKHLHVSADKLCRWLRSDHDLTPYADGLLGRNELKLKLRRRAKKSRLLSSVGGKATADTELDEGIRTGWVCVNLGTVHGGELPKTAEEVAREAAVVGFNAQIKGSRIVVQLMTEEKRGEIDLERLWSAVLTKSSRAKEALVAEGEDIAGLD